MSEASNKRIVIQLENFRKAMGRLEEMLQRNEDDAVRDAVVLRFLFTFEMAWKAAYYYLAARGERIEKSSWAVLREAFTAHLIKDVAKWDDLRKYRNVIGHEYDERQAIEIVAYVRAHAVPACRELYNTLQLEHGRNP